jgi:hypothetical protein
VHLVVGALLVLAGLACLRYVWGGAAAIEREPPLLALGVLLVGIGAGLGVRARAAHLLARVGLSAYLVVIGVMVARLYVGSGARDHPDDRLVAHVYLLSFALVAAGVVLLFLLLRRARSAPAFGAIDLVPLGGLAAALGLGIVWLVADDARLRPCRNGNDEACGVVAIALLESAEHAPSAPPTRGEERAARVLAEHRCRVADRGLCGLQRYAVGLVAVRAGRFDAAKEAFLWACAADRSWCARAAREPLDWTPAERERLSDDIGRSEGTAGCAIHPEDR